MSEIPNPVEQQNLAWEDGYRQGLAAAEARAEELASINRELVEAHNTLLARISKSDVRAEAAERKVAAGLALADEWEHEADLICPPREYDKADKAWRVAHVRRRVADELRAALDTAADTDTPTPTRWERA